MSLAKSAQRVQDVLDAHGVRLSVQTLPSSTRTAQEAADSIGCTVPQIVKSLIFQGKTTQKPYLVLASGTNRVSESRIKSLVGEPITKPNADFVREVTGYAIGGVPPIGHATEIETLIDEDLGQYEVLWAAAGTPNAVFSLEPSVLVNLTKGKVTNISR